MTAAHERSFHSNDTDNGSNKKNQSQNDADDTVMDILSSTVVLNRELPKHILTRFDGENARACVRWKMPLAHLKWTN